MNAFMRALVDELSTLQPNDPHNAERTLSSLSFGYFSLLVLAAMISIFKFF
jgi:hypothetical protein